MIPLRAITTCVGYADLLAITLPRNKKHFSECLVITAPEDRATIEFCQSLDGVQLHITDAFTRHGARFNKGLAIEEGFDRLGRHGYILIWDSDILLPDQIPYASIKPDRLHGCRRRLCENVAEWHPDKPWGRFSVNRDAGPIGYFQLFNAADPVIRDRRPWYDVTFAYAGGGDAYFVTHWTPFMQTILNMDVLHLGPCNTNWFGTDPEGRNIMAAFVVRNKWRRSMPIDLRAVEQVGDIIERIEVPGYKSTYELPFVVSARESRKES